MRASVYRRVSPACRWLLATVLLIVASPLLAQSAPIAQAQAPRTSALQQPSGTAPASISNPLDEQSVDDEDLAAAALAIDQTQSPPLIQALYLATRETKEKPTLDRIAEASTLLENGADIHAMDALGRTALHWTVFGSSFNTRPSVLVAYERLADTLIQRGIDINQEDAYHDTALDYLLYSPNFEIQTLLLEHGATSGFLAASFRFFDQLAQGNQLTPANNNADTVQPAPRRPSSAAAKADLAPGATLSIRLNGPVYSERSRPGDPILGTVTYPLCRSGEDLACPPGELLLAPGTQVNGTVLFAQKAPDKYSRPRLVLDFSNVVHPDGSVSALYARVLDVDNARETVRNNEILGIIQPHANSKASLALSAVGAINPIAGYAVRGVSTVYGLSIRREVLFPAGTDLQVQIVRPSMLKRKDQWTGWPVLPTDSTLRTLVTAAPLRTTTPGKTPSDLTNLLFIGTQQQLLAAFQEAGWFQADNKTLVSSLNAVQATLRNTDYHQGPVFTLLLDGRAPDLVFQKSLDTFAQRHHIRVWKLPTLYNGREVWVGAATHDIANSSSRGKTKWSHRIDPHIDRERDWIQSDLLFAGTASAYCNIDRPAAPRKAGNATGDEVVTDGKMAVVQLAGATPRETTATLLKR